MSSSLPPIPPPITTPQIVQLPITPANPNERPTRFLRMSTLRKIGAVVVAWGRMENAINDLIWTINGKTMSSGRLDTQELDITKLLSALQKAISNNMPGDNLKNERKAITNIINKINEFKIDRNAVVHGTWAVLNHVPVVGSLRFESTHSECVTFESYDHTRLELIEKVAIEAATNAGKLIARIEALRKRPSPQQ